MARYDHTLLIFHPGALGDGLLALSALRALKAKYFGHRIIWFGHKELGDVFVDAHEVHESYDFESLNFLAFENGKHSPRGLLSGLLGGCERAVGWLKDSDGTWQNWFRNVGIKDFILRSPHDPTLLQNHMADRYVETLHPWLSTQGALTQLKPIFYDGFLFGSQSTRLGQPCLCMERLIVLHPGSGSIHKCAPLNLLAEIVNGLMVRPNWRVCLVAGPADTESLRKIQGLLADLKPTIIKGLDLLSIGRFLQGADLFIGHDSGLSHLASRLGVPSVLLFGPSDPSKWAPRGSHVTVIQKSCHCMGKETIGHCIDKRCFSISTNEVMAKVTEILCGPKIPASQGTFKSLVESTSVPCLG